MNLDLCTQADFISMIEDLRRKNENLEDSNGDLQNLLRACSTSHDEKHEMLWVGFERERHLQAENDALRSECAALRVEVANLRKY